ncbi:MAG: carbohydrate binding domain-containing protein [Clostridia bacterium]|nr:carbohydrate binding domain-containing protein [Clostridia bacterium]
MNVLRKLFCILLCLSILLPCGVISAEEENLLSGTWSQTTGSLGATMQNGKVTLPLQNSAGIASAYIPVIKGATYELSFTYSLPIEGKGSVKVCGFNRNDDETEIGSVVPITKLSAGRFVKHTLTFSPKTIGSGTIVRYVKVNFASTIVSESTDVFTVSDIKLVRVPGNEMISNGGAEMIWQGKPVGIIGGTCLQNTPDAQSGNNMMRVDAGEEMHLPLVLEKEANLAKITGFLKKGAGLTEESRVTVSVREDNKDGIVLSEKPVRFTGEKWELIRFSALPMRPRLIVSVKVENAGCVYADGFQIEADKNILRNPAFTSEGVVDEEGKPVTWAIENTWFNTKIKHANDDNVYLNDTFYDTSTGETVSVVNEDGNCPDGQNYIEAAGCGKMVLIRTRSAIPVKEGEKYRISVWMKTEGGSGRIAIATQQSAIRENYPGWSQFIVDENTGGVWKHISFTLSVPKGMTSFNLNLRTQGAVAADKKISFNMPCVEKIEKNEVGFFVQEMEASASGATVMVAAPRLEPYGYAFQNVLGSPVERITGLSGALTAVGQTVDSALTTDAIMIMATYTYENGERELLAFKIGEPPSDPAWTTGVKDLNGNDVKGVKYPTVSMPLSEIDEETDEIRAFLWDSAVGVRAEGKTAVLCR